MAVVFRRVSKTRRRNRNSHIAQNIHLDQIRLCPRCDSVKIKYNVCLKCKYHHRLTNGVEVASFFKRNTENK